MSVGVLVKAGCVRRACSPAVLVVAVAVSRTWKHMRLNRSGRPSSLHARAHHRRLALRPRLVVVLLAVLVAVSGMPLLPWVFTGTPAVAAPPAERSVELADKVGHYVGSALASSKEGGRRRGDDGGGGGGPQREDTNPPAASQGQVEVATPEEQRGPEPVKEQRERLKAEPAADGELVEKRTLKSRTFVNPDGTHTTEVATGPMHFRRHGKWEKIDTNLADDGADAVRADRSAMPVRLKRDAAKVGLATLQVDETHTVSFHLEGARSVPAEVVGSKATYRGVFDQVDLELQSTPIGLKENLLLASAAVPDRYRFRLDSPGLTASIEDKTGDVVFADEKGAVISRIPHGWMQDSSRDPKTGGPAQPNSRGVVYELSGRAPRQALIVKLDRAWLNDPARVWPVKVDPTMINAVPTDDTYSVGCDGHENEITRTSAPSRQGAGAR